MKSELDETLEAKCSVERRNATREGIYLNYIDSTKSIFPRLHAFPMRVDYRFLPYLGRDSISVPRNKSDKSLNSQTGLSSTIFAKNILNFIFISICLLHERVHFSSLQRRGKNSLAINAIRDSKNYTPADFIKRVKIK